MKAYKANGRNGHCLQEEWELKEQPKAYKCVTHPNYPNMFYCLGPNAGLGHNTVVYMIECQNNYAIDSIKKLIASGHKSMDCKQEPFDKYHEELFQDMKLIIWTIL